MAWNRPTESGEANSRSLQKRSGDRFPFRGAIIGAIVTFGAAVVAWFIWPSEETRQDVASAEKQTLIKVVTPAAAPKAEEVKPLTKEEKRLKEIKYFEDKFGTNMPPGVKTHVYFLKHPPKVYRPKTEYGFFRHPSDRQIASILAVEPGTFMLDKLEFGESFNRDFLASLLDKTEILETDDEETRAVKESVAAAKEQMNAIRKAEGKLPSEILTEHAALLYDLGRFEQNLENELNEFRNNPDVSDQDVADLFAAANRMRAEKGLPEQKVPDFSKRAIRLQKRLARQNARQKGKEVK